MRISDWSSDVCSSDLAEAMAKPSSWSLDDSGKILRYPHVSPNQDFTVKVSGELLAADGTRLGRDVEQRVHTGELDPAVGFASQGSVLPAKESRGLPGVSVHVRSEGRGVGKGWVW